MSKALVLKCLTLIVVVQIALANGGYGVGGYAGGGGGGGGHGIGQIHMPYQLLNVLDLLVPFHVRVSTDGIRHKP